MTKVLLLSLISTILLAQTHNIDVIERNNLEIGTWVKESKINKTSIFIDRHIKENLNILAENVNLDNASEADILKYFSSSKTGKFISRYKQLQPK